MSLLGQHPNGAPKVYGKNADRVGGMRVIEEVAAQ